MEHFIPLRGFAGQCLRMLNDDRQSKRSRLQDSAGLMYVLQVQGSARRRQQCASANPWERKESYRPASLCLMPEIQHTHMHWLAAGRESGRAVHPNVASSWSQLDARRAMSCSSLGGLVLRSQSPVGKSYIMFVLFHCKRSLPLARSADLLLIRCSPGVVGGLR